MNYSEKILLLNKLIDKNNLEVNIVYDILERCGIIKSNYYSYMTTAPINCDEELLRLKSANYDLCCALITMLLREDYHCNGKFKRRQSSGEVRSIIERIIFWLESMRKEKIQCFSPQSVKALNGFYVYALLDPSGFKRYTIPSFITYFLAVSPTKVKYVSSPTTIPLTLLSSTITSVTSV